MHGRERDRHREWISNCTIHYNVIKIWSFILKSSSITETPRYSGTEPFYSDSYVCEVYLNETLR